jgi:methyltransferase (TIGR00027 family)
LTALYVALARAVATHDRELARACDDPWALQLLPLPLRGLVELGLRLPASRALRVMRASMLGLAEHMALRTRLIDDAVSAAVEHGARQLVVLGAGLDSRAHRLHALHACDVFEVDFPSTQAFKREQARRLPQVARALHYVSCDFEHQALDQVLLARGFSMQLPSVWIWEGVTMYLSEASIASSLDTIARLSGAGSRLIATYLVPMPDANEALTKAAVSILGALSEPLRSFFEPDAMTALLSAHQFSTLSDVSPRDVAARYAVRFPTFAFGAPGERIAVAERRGPT